MEVLDGNQSNPGQTRRRQDQHIAERRFLNWSSRASDIALRPHSPLAIADVLSQTGNCFDLVALETTEAAELSDKKGQENVEQPNQLQQRRQRRHPRSRANLLTELSADALVANCKKIQVENALVKRAGLQRLYLVAGFLSIKQKGAEPVLAPLLFYPVTLLRKPINKDSKTETDKAVGASVTTSCKGPYQIRIDSAQPDTNIELLEWCANTFECALPDFDETQPLQDYFTQIAAVIADKPNLELDFNTALGTAATPEHSTFGHPEPVRLPDLPENFNAGLAMAITTNKNLTQLNTVLNLLRDYSMERVTISKLTPVANESSQSISELRKYSEELAAEGLQDVEFQHLPTLPENIATWVSSVSNALKTDMVSRLLDMPDINARHMIRLANVIELIDKAPLSLEQYQHADLCFSATPGLLQRARHQAKLIEDELAELQKTFVLDKVPAKKQLLSLIEELGVNLEDESDIVDSDYFNARRQFMEFSIEKPTNLTPEHRRMLGQLAKVLRFRELFVNNTEYRLALGPGYRGLRTNWEALSQMLEYSQELAEVLESEAIAAAAMSKWDQFRRVYVNELETLQNGANALRKLLWICGSQWQKRPAIEVLARAKKLKKKLNDWADAHTTLKAHTVKTPASVLAQFSGKSKEDVITEIHVGATQATIDEHLSAGGTSSKAVVETIEWLRSASKTASANQLDIEAIVDHLNIA